MKVDITFEELSEVGKMLDDDAVITYVDGVKVKDERMRERERIIANMRENWIHPLARLLEDKL
jgi:hypothetical protein